MSSPSRVTVRPLSWSALSGRATPRPPTGEGAAATSPVGGLGVALPEEALRLGGLTVTRLGDDILLEGEVEAHVHGSD